MIYPDVSVEEWCRRHSLDRVSGVCDCGHSVLTDKPYITSKYIGLTTSCTGCGKAGVVNTYVHRDRAEGEAMLYLIFGENT